MTKNYELDLRDIVDCAHEPETPIVSEGEIVGYVCRCGRFQPMKDKDTNENTNDKPKMGKD
jgi:hypothetical protein